MNRRSFLVRLGQVAAAATATLVVDPEQLLWVPGQKTIIDLGATKQVLPATDNEIVDQATRDLIYTERGWVTRKADADMRRGLGRDTLMPWQKVERDVRLDITGADGELRSFNYKGDKLVGVYSEADMRLLDQPLASRKRTHYDRRG